MNPVPIYAYQSTLSPTTRPTARQGTKGAQWPQGWGRENISGDVICYSDGNYFHSKTFSDRAKIVVFLLR